jgi:hypothetical protein
LIAPFDDIVNLQFGFDFYSWLTFIALNTPADGQNVIGRGPGAGGDSITKWEQYKQLPDVMLLPKGKPPAPQFEALPGSAPSDVAQHCGKRIEAGSLVIHLEAEDTYNQPFKSGPLIDQNGYNAYFVILMNEPMFRYILNNNLYSIKGQEAFKRRNEVDFGKFDREADEPKHAVDPNAPGIVNFPNGSADDDSPKHAESHTIGSIMIKASWKQLGPSDDPSKFHTNRAIIYTPGSADGTRPATCVAKTLGMVGFHIGHKTNGAHQWVWSTFEHVNNVPAQHDVDEHKISGQTRFNFYNPECNPSNCPANKTPPRPWDPATQPFPGGFRSQITRVIPITPSVANLNSAFRAILTNTVWENYMLVSTQWPSLQVCAQKAIPSTLPDPTCAPAPTYLANTTLETYSQGNVPLASSSCIACHGNATTHHKPATPSDFTFILEKAH